MRSIACIAVLVPLLAACAIGNTIDYQSQTVPLAVRSDKAVLVRVDDRRPYVVSREESPNFVGVVRTGVGLPYSVITHSGRPFAEELAASVSRSLQASGIRAAPADPAVLPGIDPVRLLPASGAQRLLLLTLIDWKSDKYAATTLSYAVKADVLDPAGRNLGSSTAQGQQIVPGAATVDPSEHSARGVLAVTQQVIRQLLDDPQVVAALR